MTLKRKNRQPGEAGAIGISKPVNGDPTAEDEPDPASLQHAARQACEAFEYETAIAYYSQALAHEDLSGYGEAMAYDLLAGRAKCYGQAGDLQAQAADLEVMAHLAQEMGDVTRQIEVINQQVTLAGQLGNAAEGQHAAEVAVTLARQAGDRSLEASSLTALGYACEELSDYTRAEQCYEQARNLYRELGDRSGEAHSLWDLGLIAAYTDRPSEAQAYLEPALALYRELGDRAGEANVLNTLGLAVSDDAQRRAYFEQALAIFQAIGNRERQSLLYNNLGLVYGRLGLYGQARDYGEQAVQIARDMQMPGRLSASLESLGRAYLGLGAYGQAHQVFAEGRALAHDVGDRSSEAQHWLGLGRVALASGRSDEASEHLQRAAAMFGELDIPANQAVVLAWQGALYLAQGDRLEAQRYTAEAVALLGAADDVNLEYPPQEVWWLHYQALIANQADVTPKPPSRQKAKARQRFNAPGEDPAWAYLGRARESMMAGIATLSDEGLRRNYLNKVQVNREIVIEWTRQATKRGESLAALTEVARADNIQDQLKRMLDIGVRMTARGEAATLPSFIMNEVVELSGAERAFLVLLDKAGQQAVVAVSGISLLEIESLKTQATPVLDKVADSLQAVLLQDVGDDMMQEGDVPELVLRSVLGIPLVSRSQLMGMIYADMRIINGHFAQADVDLLTVLANQAAAAIENAEWARTLEERVAERTAELTTINSISQALNSQLELDALIELVGEKVRQNFDAEIVYIALYDRQTNMIHFPYEFGDQLSSIPFGQGLSSKIIESGQPLLINEDVPGRHTELGARLIGRVPKSYLGVPITAGDRLSQGDHVIGVISVQSTEEEGRFDEADVRLLTTIAANVGVAIQKAQLYEETKEAKEIAEATNQELSQTLDHLRTTQAQLIQAEKMAALGQLIAGIAHEINTPLGAIRASISNISHALGDSIEQLPELFQLLSPAQQRDFFALLDKAWLSQTTLSSREERKLKQTLRHTLEGHGIEEADLIADMLVDMGIYEGIEDFVPLFGAENITFIMHVAYNLVSQQKNSQNIITAVERASKVVFALKSYTHQSHTGEMIEAKVTDGIDVVLTLYQNQLKQGVEVIKNYQDVPLIRCSPDELNQVWTNLVHNALQAMENRGKLEIEVFQQNNLQALTAETLKTTETSPGSEARYVVVQITDSGPGIPEEIQDRIFEPFFTTKAAGEGSGLGLDIVRKIVEKHQGVIAVESQPGKTTFSVLLPIGSH